MTHYSMDPIYQVVVVGVGGDRFITHYNIFFKGK